MLSPRFVPVAGTLSYHWSLFIQHYEAQPKSNLGHLITSTPKDAVHEERLEDFRKFRFEIRRFLVRQIRQRQGSSVVLIDKLGAIRYSHIAKGA